MSLNGHGAQVVPEFITTPESGQTGVEICDVITVSFWIPR